MDSILFCDVGNTAIDLLLKCADGHRVDHFFPCEKDRMAAFLKGLEGKSTAYVSSVSSKNLSALEEVLLFRGFSVVRLDKEQMRLSANREGLAIGNLDILGQDLFCDILAAGKNSIVADFGTATKILAVDKEGLFLGGSILPGIPAFPKILFQETDLLPDFLLKGEDTPLLSLKTKECIASGAIHGTAFLIEGYLAELAKRKGLEGARILFTGGNFPYVEKALSKRGDYIRELSLTGLKKAFQVG